ncbi:hypothetical protein [Mycobacterium sp. HUMS_1102779]|uniref:hypothetical protein n=1 Tax=Mycobacterium sp. HUMS_1102779 TaxID=3383487 RepID=UPI00389B0BAD
MDENRVRRQRAELDSIASSINGTTMRDVDHADDDSVLENRTKQAKFASTRREPAIQLTAKPYPL